MASKKTVIITLILIFSLFGISLVVMKFTDRMKQNPDGTVGNTPGNLNNGGHFCEADGMVYFSNPFDEECLYRMTSDEQDIKKMNNSPSMYINAGGDYLYYFQPNASGASDLGFIIHNAGLYRCNKNGKRVYCLDRSNMQTVALINNRLFYEKAVKGAKTLQLASIGTDKEKPEIVLDYLANPASCRNGLFYYNGTVRDHYLYSYDTKTGEIELICEYSMWFPTLQGNTIYFLDIENNYRLARYDLTTGTITTLTNDRVDCFNVSDTYIYYQKNDQKKPALMRMQKDGSNPELIAEGIFCDINLTSEYMYCRVFGTQMPIYHMPVNGPCELTIFDGAKTAVTESIKKKR